MNVRTTMAFLFPAAFILLLVACSGDTDDGPTIPVPDIEAPAQGATPVLSTPSPNDSSSSTNYAQEGTYYLIQGDYEKAIEQYNEAIRLNPQDADTYHNRSVAYRLIGKSVEAERDFAKAKELGYDP